jgi:hypothetical protein
VATADAGVTAAGGGAGGTAAGDALTAARGAADDADALVSAGVTGAGVAGTTGTAGVATGAGAGATGAGAGGAGAGGADAGATGAGAAAAGATAAGADGAGEVTAALPAAGPDGAVGGAVGAGNGRRCRRRRRGGRYGARALELRERRVGGGPDSETDGGDLVRAAALDAEHRDARARRRRALAPCRRHPHVVQHPVVPAHDDERLVRQRARPFEDSVDEARIPLASGGGQRRGEHQQAREDESARCHGGTSRARRTASAMPWPHLVGKHFSTPHRALPGRRRSRCFSLVGKCCT